MGTNRKLIKLSLGLTIPKTAKECRTVRSGSQWKLYVLLIISKPGGPEP